MHVNSETNAFVVILHFSNESSLNFKFKRINEGLIILLHRDICSMFKFGNAVSKSMFFITQFLNFNTVIFGNTLFTVNERISSMFSNLSPVSALTFVSILFFATSNFVFSILSVVNLVSLHISNFFIFC